MDSAQIAKLDVRPLREAFPHEALHFTRWLEAHIDALSERIGLTLRVVQSEQAVGDFSVDLVCEDGNGQQVIVENQLERTDHRHLGQVLTYLVNLDAKTAIWVTADARPEHEKVINWLNESTPADISFYLVRVEAIRIGNSPFAPLFTVMARPDQQSKEIGEKKKEWADRNHRCLAFWESLIDRSKGRTKLFTNLSPGKETWLGTGAGKSGVAFNYNIWTNAGGVELYIDYAHDAGQKNKTIFDALYAQRDAIEREFEGPLEWSRLDEKRASRIGKHIPGGGLTQPDTWPTLQDQMIDAMIRLDRALRPRLAKIEV